MRYWHPWTSRTETGGKQLKILLVSPPTISDVQAVVGTTGPPLGLAYLASVALEKGHEVRIVDALVEGLNLESLKKIIGSYSPDVVGITSTTSMMPDAYQVARIAKETSIDTKVVMGGPHVTFTPETTLTESPEIDYVVRGEGENIFSNLLDFFSGKRDISDVRGISYRAENGIFNSPSELLIRNVDDIPEPALDLLPMKKYKVGKSEFGTIVTSRGCPYNCMFCSSSLQFGKIWRGHSAARVLRELETLRYKYGKREIEFLDDTFTLNLKRATALTDMIRKEDLDISWSASARVNLFNRDIANSMKRAGTHTVYFGIESGVQKTLDFIGKGIDLQMAVTSVRNAHEAGLRSLGSFIIGFPDDTEDDVRKTISFSKRLGVSFAQFTIATPYPGTRLWDYARNKNLITTGDWRKFTTLTPVMKLKNFQDQDILRWLQKAYIGFYMRPFFLLKDIFRNRAFIFKRIIPYSRAFLHSGIMNEDQQTA